MAEQAEIKEQGQEVVKDTKSPAPKVKAKPKSQKNTQPKRVKYYNVDDFIASVKGSGLYNINNMKLANFRALMISKDMYMVEDENEFLSEFENFIKS